MANMFFTHIVKYNFTIFSQFCATESYFSKKKKKTKQILRFFIVNRNIYFLQFIYSFLLACQGVSQNLICYCVLIELGNFLNKCRPPWLGDKENFSL